MKKFSDHFAYNGLRAGVVFYFGFRRTSVSQKILQYFYSQEVVAR